MLLEPCTHGHQGEVHGGGGREEGGARDEHAGAAQHDAQTQPPNIGTKLTENTSVEIHLAQSRHQSKDEPHEVEDQHGVGLSQGGVEPAWSQVNEDVEI